MDKQRTQPQAGPKVFMLGAGINLAVLAIIGLFVFGLDATADDDVPRLIPYEGYLELDGEPVTMTGSDAMTMTFELCDGSDCGSVVFAQTMNVNVFSGRFIALIGEDNADGAVTVGTTLEEALGKADDIYVRMSIETPTGTETLSSTRRLLMQPHALFATHASSFSVTRGVTVGGDATIGGDLLANGNTLTAGGEPALVKSGEQLRLGDFYDILFTGKLQTDDLTLSGDLHVDGDFEVDGDELSLNGDRLFRYTSGDTLQINDGGAGGALQIQSTLLVEGDIDARSTVTIGNGTTASLHFEGDDYTSAEEAFLTFDQDGSSGDTRLAIEYGNNSNDDVQFKTNGTTRMEMNSGGVTFQDTLDVSAGDLNLGISIRDWGDLEDCASGDTTDCHDDQDNGWTYMWCKSGEVVLGGGAYGDTAGNDESLHATRPAYSSPNWGWLVKCVSQGGDNERCIDGYLICASNTSGMSCTNSNSDCE